MYWKIEPCGNNDCDSFIMPANTEYEHQSALNFAQGVLEDLWDASVNGPKKFTVTMELCNGDMPETEFNND